MCGIAGFYETKNIDSQLIEHKLINMGNSIKHRGPDNTGFFSEHFVGLTHTRLSIRDLTGGNQPITNTYQNRTATIIYNGEIYNDEELRFRINNFNIHWKTHSDAETILNGYLVFGTDFFKELNGIFAFAIYENDTLIIARDQIGVKPLFFYKDLKEFVFASEPKGIFAYGIKPAINKDSWCEIIGLGPANSLDSGVFKDIKQLRPGHFMTVSSSSTGELSIEDFCYWKLTSHLHTEDYFTTVDHTNFLIKDSIKRQLVSDIPICTFLSGGLDSSLVSAIAAANLDSPLDTFSFDFAGNDKNFKANSFQSSRDRPFVDIMTNHIKSNHHYLECNNTQQIEGLFQTVDARDIPCMADVESSMLYFCGLVSKDFKVALTGECADEIFGGYPWFHKEEMLNQNTFPWSFDLDARTSLFNQEFINSLNLSNYVDSAYTNSVAECPLLVSDNSTEQNRRIVSYLNIKWFMMTLLNRMDRCSMYNGLEARVPFADVRILEYVFNVPWEYKCHGGQAKSLLVECGKDYLPPEVLYRKKSPYPKTYDPAYEKLLGQMLLDEVGINSSLAQILDMDKLIKFIESPKDYGKPWYGQLMAGPQMLAYVLQIGYWMKKYSL